MGVEHMQSPFGDNNPIHSSRKTISAISNPYKGDDIFIHSYILGVSRAFFSIISIFSIPSNLVAVRLL